MYTSLIAATIFGTRCLADLTGLPTVPFKTSGYGNSTLDLTRIKKIVVDSKYADAKDTNGYTLIPPTLNEFALTFATDMVSLLPAYQNISLGTGNCTGSSEIFLTIGNHSGFHDVAGRWTSEAYKIEVTTVGIKITGASPLGVWWGTRSVLQQAVLGDGKIMTGYGVDSPGWGTRGFFLDAGRHYYPPEFLIEMCNWISFYKQNTFHIHLSDNLYNNVDIYSLERQLTLYSAFRLWSNDSAVAGLNKRRNESYTREDFDHIQYSCAARGVTVIPEIEAPGHGLVFTQWKPELAIAEQFDLLNITYPDTIPVIQSVWKTFMPWFHSKVVHLGADEYVDSSLSKTALAEVYNDFVNAMNSYIGGFGKQVRIWGTFPPQKNYTNNIATNVTIQHWEFFEDYPYQDYIQKGYNVINSDDHFYIVTKYSTSYRQVLNKTLIFHGNPDGGAWSPYVFDPNNSTNNPPKNSSSVVGHLAAQWNDYGPNTSTYLEAYYSWRDHGPALADKQWGGKITEEEYDTIYEKLQIAAPGQNLDRRVESKTSTILSYRFTMKPPPYYGYRSFNDSLIKDLSGNGYDAKTNCSMGNGTLLISKGCSVSTPLESKGLNYTLSFTLKQTTNATGGAIFTGPDSELRSGNGTSNKLMLVSAGNAFALNYSLPVGEWVDASLIGKGNQTFLSVNNCTAMEFQTIVGVNGASFAWTTMAIVAPLSIIGGGSWEGQMKSVKLVDYAV